MNRQRLFLGSCFSLISTSVCFAVIGAIMGSLKSEFILSNEQVGYIGGAATWGFTVSIFVLGPLCDVLGMKNLMRFAMLCHAAGTLIMIFATGQYAYWMLFVGALILSLGNGTVEAVCNPLIATIYPDQKTKKLNQFHVWFPGGILIGGVICYLLNKGANIGIDDWRIKVALILIPTIIYAFLFIGQKFPATERVQSGISFQSMVKGALLRPLFLILLICMCVTASLELGPGRWVPAVLEAGMIPGILVLAYINGLMAVLRFFAGPVVHKLSPTGILVSSAILAGIGLYWFSFAESTGMAFASATVFAVGVCYFWPTMLGVVSERVPRSGAFGLALMGGIGMLMVGVVTTPQMGKLADKYLHEKLQSDHAQQTITVLQKVVDTFPAAAESAPDTIKKEIMGAVNDAAAVITTAKNSADGITLPEGDTAKALRNVTTNAPTDDESKALVDEINKNVLGPSDNYGGRMSFRYIAPFSFIIIIVFGIIYIRDRAAGGYKVETIN